MKKIAEEYSNQQKKGRPFVHMRGTKSSNRYLKAIGEALKGEKLYRVTLHGKDGGSVLANARKVEELLKEHDCQTFEAVEEVLEAEVRGTNWREEVDIFEQHMLEEDSIRVDWTNDGSKEGAHSCPMCGDWNMWGSMHDCCRMSAST